jgi:hypothetical protein
MDPNALARSNHLFFYVDLTQHCLLTEAFKELCRTGALDAAYWEKYPDNAPAESGIQQLPFKCQNGELGYLRFTNDTAKIIVESQIQPLPLVMKIPRFIQGEFNERCEFALNYGIKVSFRIVGYEGDLNNGRGYVEIANPVSECSSDDCALGRMVEMSVVYP